MANLEAKVKALLKILKKEKQSMDEGTSMVEKTPILPTLDSSLRVYGENPFNWQKWGKSLNNQSSHYFHPKIELPFFYGNNPRKWIRKCDKFFLVYQIEEEYKTDVVEMYLEGKVNIWYQSLKLTQGRIAWSELIIKQFGATGVMDEIEEFNKLQQQGSLMEYQEQFESLRTLMLVARILFYLQLCEWPERGV